MSKTAIIVEALSKCYRIGAREEGYKTFRETMIDVLSAPIRNFKRLRGLTKFEQNSPSWSTLAAENGSSDVIWALRDVSFEVEEGIVLGIIGRNGAGKSTLLKILSRITDPSRGDVKIYGRVSSLLEVGTGFHPELTGRENIYLNGAILGMRKSEIHRKFNEIVDFAEIEKFIDTPVKRYSSGMYVRLAFAVAAHLDPEVLLIDEVLAVGDAQFQKKCLGKMKDVSTRGRTVLFISHNMRAVQHLCNRAIWLNEGMTMADGTSQSVIEKYLRCTLQAEEVSDIPALIASLPPDPVFRLQKINICQEGELTNRVVNGNAVEIEIQYEVAHETSGLRIFFDLCDNEDNILIRSFHDDDADEIPITKPGQYLCRANIPANLLSPTTYHLRIQAGIFNVRMCTPEGGINIPLVVEPTSHVNRAYMTDPVVSKLTPYIPWENSKLK
jgi:lipopolysaccharide transport system ATP-binding protein